MKNVSISDFSDDNIEYIIRIRTQYSSLSKKQKKIANYILNHTDEVNCSSISILAKKIGTTPSSITRFCQALSYKGFSELKVYMEKNLISPEAVNTAITSDDKLPVLVQKLMISARDAYTETMRTLDTDKLSEVIDILLKSKMVHLYGQSSAYYSALYGRWQV